MTTQEKLSPLERALVAAAAMDGDNARRVLMLICQNGMPVHKPKSQGQKHFEKREPYIKQMQAACDKVLDRARRDTLRKIEEHFNGKLESAEGDPGSGDVTAQLLFDKKKFHVELVNALQDAQYAAMVAGKTHLFAEVGYDNPWVIPARAVFDFLDTRANLLSEVPDEVHRTVMDSIEAGLKAGDTKAQLMARIESAFDEISKGRASTIANTETAAAFNFARDKAMRQAGVTHKKWLHSQSPLIKEPRETHVEASGQVVPIDEPFDVGGVQFMHPGDDSLGAGPEDIINCHCVSIATTP